MGKERAYRDDAGDEEMVPESSDSTETVSEFSEVNTKSQKTLIWNLKEIQTLHILKKAQVQRFCLRKRSLLLWQRSKRLQKGSGKMPQMFLA